MDVFALITDLTDVKPFKIGWKSQVKILHSWTQYTQYSGKTMKMILADKNVSIDFHLDLHYIRIVFSILLTQLYFTNLQGTLIHATVKKQKMRALQRFIISQEWRNVENFTL